MGEDKEQMKWVWGDLVGKTKKEIIARLKELYVHINRYAK